MKRAYSLFKEGKYFKYWTYINGKRVKRSTGKQTKGEALQVINQRIADGTLKGAGASMLFKVYAEPFFDMDRCPYIRDVIARKGHYSSSRAGTNRAYIFNHLIPRWGDMRLDEIKAKDINKWLLSLCDETGLKEHSANCIFYTLRTILDYAVADELITVNPARSVKRLLVRPTARPSFTQEDIDKLFAKPWEATLVEVAALLAASTGMRIGEIRALTKEQVHEDYILIDRSWSDHDHLKAPKSGKARIVPITPYIYERVISMADDKKFIFSIFGGQTPASVGYFERWLRRRMEACGVTGDKTFHSFRHYFNTKLVSAQIPGDVTRAVIGHETFNMTMRYLHMENVDFGAVRKVQEGIIKESAAE